MKLLLRIFFAVLTSLLLCQITFWISKNALKSFNIHKTERLAEIFTNKTYFDLIFIGSSRTHTSIHPQIIDTICKIKSYNAGVEGGNLYEFKLTLDGYLVNHPSPRFLVLTLDINSFDLKRKFFNYTQYFSCLNNSVVKNRLNQSGYNTLLFSVLPFMEFTQYDDFTRGNILKGIIGKVEIQTGDFQYKGFLSNTTSELNGITSNRVIPSSKIPTSADADKLLIDIIQTCKDKNIELIFTYAPEFDKRLQDVYINKGDFFEKINIISETHKITFLRHDQLILCKDPTLFANYGHVNKLGSFKYSEILAKELNLHFNK